MAAAVYSPMVAGLLGLQPLVMGDWLVIVPLAILPAVIGQGIRLVGEPGREGNSGARDQMAGRCSYPRTTRRH